jgi:hypothetical protein
MSNVILPPLVWKPSPNFSSRNGTKIDLLVYHESAGHYNGDVAWLRNPVAQASAMGVLREDGGEFTQLVKMQDKAWHAAYFNPRSIGIEHSNVTAKGYATEQQLRVSARIFAWLCRLYGISPRFSRGGAVSGICRHLDLGGAGSNHPYCGMGDNDLARWLQMIHDELARGGFRKVWAR